MSEIASKTLYTSEGVVRPGEPIPDRLPKKEMKAIGDAGGFALLPARVRTDEDRSAIYAAAVGELKAAEASVEQARSEADKADAQKRLEAARKTLFDLNG
ncbi:hypothetical protein [Aurantimonas sp. 22II-16-19i]|uniref:hypothetical protein n=1 Tax=Aurantimonas sp. 22II-16-19i TaxID=1317114 RepID=UPI0009F7F4E5|nr:hypothetical protein [Aurantimonas sp. 22II-16-19i]ORE89750.1 hypothetical protein ATO4_23767 [Aurantimonas sp. 22II-16-19i]